MPEKRLWLYPDGDFAVEPELWVRTGECNRCGACCELEMKLRYTSTRAAEDQSDTGITMDNFGFPRGQPISCEEWEGYFAWWQKKPASESTPICSSYLGNGVCACYDEADRPEICRKWPVLPGDLHAFPQCGFAFEIVEK